MKHCKNPRRHESEWLCICPKPGRSAREVLRSDFQGWLSAAWVSYARAKAEDAKATEEELLHAVERLENVINDCHGTWLRSCA
jgi:hypothetical protein